MYVIVERDYIAHHGVLGQKWGKRNGPPYPLSRQGSEANQRFKKQYAENRKSGGSGGGGGGSKSTGEKVSNTVSGKSDSSVSFVKKSISKITNNKLFDKTSRKTVNKLQKKITKDQKKKEKQAEKSKTDLQKLKDKNPEEYESQKQKALKEGTAEDVLKFKGDLTNQQMLDASTRLSWEKKLSDQAQEERDAGWKTLNNTMKKIGDVANWAESSYKLINNVSNILNKFDKIANPESNKSQKPKQETPKIIQQPKPQQTQQAPKQETPKVEQPKKSTAKEDYKKSWEEYKKEMKSGWEVEGEGTSTAKQRERKVEDAEFREISFLPAVISNTVNNSFKSSKDNTIEGVFRDISEEKSSKTMNDTVSKVYDIQPSQILMLEDKHKK